MFGTNLFGPNISNTSLVDSYVSQSTCINETGSLLPFKNLGKVFLNKPFISFTLSFTTGSTTIGNTGAFAVTTGAATTGAGGAVTLTVGAGDSGAGGDVSVTSGATTAIVDHTADLFILTGFASDTDHMWYDKGSAIAPGDASEWIRVRTPGGVRYLMLYDSPS